MQKFKHTINDPELIGDICDDLMVENYYGGDADSADWYCSKHCRPIQNKLGNGKQIIMTYCCTFNYLHNCWFDVLRKNGQLDD